MTGFYDKICIKEYLEIEETQVVCFGHPKNIYFMLNSSNIFHCAIAERFLRWLPKIYSWYDDTFFQSNYVLGPDFHGVTIFFWRNLLSIKKKKIKNSNWAIHRKELPLPKTKPKVILIKFCSALFNIYRHVIGIL